MQDLISRQAAIDAIGKTSDELYKNIKKGATFPQRQWFDGMAQAQSILENLPSVEPDFSCDGCMTPKHICGICMRNYPNISDHYCTGESWREAKDE